MEFPNISKSFHSWLAGETYIAVRLFISVTENKGNPEIPGYKFDTIHTRKDGQHFNNNNNVCRDSSVGIATRYGLDGPGIESPWGSEIFCTRPDRPWGPPSLLHNGYRVFPGGKVAGAWR